MVAFLGADGSGKSTVARLAAERLAGDFEGTLSMHLRPRLGLRPDGGGPVAQPHAEAPRSASVSLLKVLYFALDYNLGYWFKVRPMLRAGALVIFDRYCHDMLVDPRRYRYGGPRWLLRWLAAIVPQPDLWLLLDAAGGVLRARKQELVLAELDRLRCAYRGLISGVCASVLIDATQPLDAVVDAAVERIRAHRTP